MNQEKLQNISKTEDLMTDTAAFSQLRCYDDITSLDEFLDAYMTINGLAFFDYEGNGYVDRYALRSDNAYHTPENAVISYLHLAGGDALALTLLNGETPELNGMIVLYTFEDGTSVKIPVYQRDGDSMWCIDAERAGNSQWPLTTPLDQEHVRMHIETQQ